MKKTLLLLASFLSLLVVTEAQSNSEIDKLIDSLSWNSIYIIHSGHAFFPSIYGPNISELVEIGRPAAEKLFQSISIPEKTVIIHMILTKIFEPEKIYMHPWGINWKCTINKHIGMHFIFNGLAWDWIEKSNEYYVSQYQIERIKSYWDKKLHDPDNSFTINPEVLMKEIQIRDSIEFSCSDNKSYINNSKSIDFSDLQTLLTTKYPDNNFDKVFKLLGNDSIFSGSQNIPEYIYYPADGIMLDFDRDNTVRVISFLANYEGTILNNIKMTDNRDSIKRKLGEPIEWHGSSSYTYDWYYEKHGMLIAFGITNRIIDLLINKDLKK